MVVNGNTNDYLGKGLSGAKLIIKVPYKSTLQPEENIITGNVTLYGATSGEAYINGKAGERFCVRNSGAKAVVEGIGDHGCEYMTGGVAVILGAVGRNFGAGMSGGMAYILDVEENFEAKVNKEMVDIEAPSPADLETIQSKIQQHFNFTKSRLAERIIENWSEYEGKFKKVMPHDLKRVLQQAQLTEKVA